MMEKKGRNDVFLRLSSFPLPRENFFLSASVLDRRKIGSHRLLVVKYVTSNSDRIPLSLMEIQQEVSVRPLARRHLIGLDQEVRLTGKHLLGQMRYGASVSRVVEQHHVLRVDAERSQLAFGAEQVLAEEYGATVVVVRQHREEMLQHWPDFVQMVVKHYNFRHAPWYCFLEKVLHFFHCFRQ